MSAPRNQRIALDYTAGPGHAPGVGRYVRELVRALVRLPAQDAFRLELLEVGRAPRPMAGPPLGLDDAPASGPGFERRITRLPRRFVAQGRRFPALARAALGPSRQAALLHRVIPDWPPVGRLPFSIAAAEFPRLGSAAADAQAHACRQASGVFVFSSDAAQRVAERYGVPEANIYQVPVGSEHWQRDLPSQAPIESSTDHAGFLHERGSRDILVLGAVRHARYPLAALAAFEVLLGRGEDARLLVCGRPGDAQGEFRGRLAAFEGKHGPKRVRWIEDPDESKMPSCVAGSIALLHLAEDEASPVTPLEATRMGLPVVASPLPAFQEVLGSRAQFVRWDDPAEVADALAAALRTGSNPVEREALQGLAAPFTWRASASVHCAGWQRMLESL